MTQALEFYQKALKIWLQVLGENHPDVATSYNNIGFVYNNLGEYDKALEFHQKALKIRLSGPRRKPSRCGHKLQQYRQCL